MEDTDLRKERHITCAYNDSLSFFPMPHALENKI